MEYLIADEETSGPGPYTARTEAAVTRAQALSDSYAPGTGRPPASATTWPSSCGR